MTIRFGPEESTVAGDELTAPIEDRYHRVDADYDYAGALETCINCMEG